ncbi:hypothetical protein I8751_12065 [Nostocaceae cyanobacterium CENA357]|uniref:Uncharacterized protein n=1 Tax=Atlanticothrix silvestris CENA357 TaxID=1725252 RepID=A0A8J7L2B3_9CYAN|nr:hypothetical protein [Atlanticothrix silvestris]MBH8553089.1 hypothetical protein [Atlanticothrix silvestris CENA357]
MVVKFTKRLSVLTVTIFALVTFIPGIAWATPTQFYAASDIVFAQVTNAASNFASLSDVNLTPQQRQQLQGVRQRRNKEINAVLNSSQRTKLAHKLRSGNDISQALETLNLQPEQQELVKAIVQFTNLKMKTILSQHSIQVGQK